MYITHYAFLWIDEYIYIHLRIKIPLRANLTFLSLCCQKPILIIFLVLLRSGEWKGEKRTEKKERYNEQYFKISFSEKPFSWGKKLMLIAKWNFQNMQINLPFAKSYIWYAFYVEHLTCCFSSYFPLYLLNYLLYCSTTLHLED